MFRFDDSSLDQTLSQILTLTNSGTHVARFHFEHPGDFKGTPAFMPVPAQGESASTGRRLIEHSLANALFAGEVGPKKSLDVNVVLTPTLGCHTEHVLCVLVEGGSLKSVFCKAELAEAKAPGKTLIRAPF